MTTFRIPHVVVLGGGTGTFTVLNGLKQKHVHVSAVVSIADNGGSTGTLRDEYGVLPPGDIRQCLVALSEEDDIMRKLFLHRFENGSFNGHNFGNMLLTALEQINREPNFILINDAEPAHAIMERYLRDDEQPVRDDLLNATVRRLPLLSREISEPVAGDKLTRSLLRHDPALLADAILKCV